MKTIVLDGIKYEIEQGETDIVLMSPKQDITIVNGITDLEAKAREVCAFERMDTTNDDDGTTTEYSKEDVDNYVENYLELFIEGNYNGPSAEITQNA